jgi:hypothetical protein
MGGGWIWPLLCPIGLHRRPSRRLVIERESAKLMVMAAPILGSLLHCAFFVRVGDGFMHRRLLIPSIFGVLLPVAVIWIPTKRFHWAWLSPLGLAIWGTWCAAGLCVP